jgi:2-amino-4-hydroxy-6-hydroxymethyldihydropteridine diphosphokinase
MRQNKSNFVIIGLGSNLGDRQENLKNSLHHLSDFIEIEKISSIYSSKALLKNDAPDEWNKNFYNITLTGKTDLEPQTLLGKTQEIEKLIGRGSREKNNWSPRYTDIDILAYEDLVLDEKDLKIPHAEMHKRHFVILPLCEIMPEWTHPKLEMTASDIKSRLEKKRY